MEALQTTGELFVPGYRNYLVFADEAGTRGGDYYGFGSLWMPWERRGDFAAKIRGLRAEHSFDGVVRWVSVEERPMFFVELVDWFFRRRWLMFHMLVVRKADVDLSLHGGDESLGRRRHFAMFLRRKIGDFGSTRDKSYHLRVAPVTRNMTGELAKRVNRSLETEIGSRCLASVKERTIRETSAIGLSDVFVGAVMQARSDELATAGQKRVSSEIADCLGWPDLTADTFPKVDKFNIWRFWDGSERRFESTRRVKLRYPTGTLVRR